MTKCYLCKYIWIYVEQSKIFCLNAWKFIAEIVTEASPENVKFCQEGSWMTDPSGPMIQDLVWESLTVGKGSKGVSH